MSSGSMDIPLKDINTRLLDDTLDEEIDMTEEQFIDVLLGKTEVKEIRAVLEKRRARLMKNDASVLASRPFYVLAMYRSPAILLTLFIEMLVGIIVSRFEPTLRAHMLLTSFMPVLSSVSGKLVGYCLITRGNVGLRHQLLRCNICLVHGNSASHRDNDSS